MGLGSRLAHAWNAFTGSKTEVTGVGGFSGSNGWEPATVRRTASSLIADKNIIENIITRMSIDVASIDFMHARTDENENFLDVIPSGLNECLTVEANIDQSARLFLQDIVLTLLTDGVACVVPVDTTINPQTSGGYDIKTMRVGSVTTWHPKHVTVNLYNERKGEREEVTISKSAAAIVVNPLYGIMNEPNSTLQRLMRKLTQLDTIDNELANKKLDLIVQVPYVVKSDARRQLAEKKREDIEFQLRSSEYGVAWIDATDKITQLNRPVENNMLPTVEYLTEQLYSYLGITKALLEGSANEQEFLNYYSRTIEPIADAISEEFKRKFLSKTARSQRQSILYVRKPFKLVPMKDLADVIDKLSRNEVTSANEARSMIGLKPSTEPGADELRNANMPRQYTDYAEGPDGEPPTDPGGVGELGNTPVKMIGENNEP